MIFLNKQTKDLTGKIFNRLRVISFAGYFPHSSKTKKKEARWFAECSCDKSILVSSCSLTSGNTKSCGCHKKEQSVIDITGQKFGRLTVLREVSNSTYKHRSAMWECLCDCGKVIVTQGAALRNGHTKSCGCYIIDRNKELFTTHGESGTRLYQTWADMKSRCNNPSHKSYMNYGGRGIGYYHEWDDFEKFRDYALTHGYSDDLTIERADVNKGYEPGNITFIPVEEQPLNRRNSIYLTHNGVTKTLGQWASEFGINRGTAWFRYMDGLPFEHIFYV